MSLLRIQGRLLKNILCFLDASPPFPSLFIGDFNNHLHPHLDKFHTGNITPQDRPTSLSWIITEVALCDIWHVRYPETRQFSCYSSSHNALFRIDLALGTDSLLPFVDVIEYLPRSISDHSPLRVRLHLGPTNFLPKPPRRLNPFWTVTWYGFTEGIAGILPSQRCIIVPCSHLGYDEGGDEKFVYQGHK